MIYVWQVRFNVETSPPDAYYGTEFTVAAPDGEKAVTKARKLVGNGHKKHDKSCAAECCTYSVRKVVLESLNRKGELDA